MDFKFSKDQDDSPSQSDNGSKGNQNALLIVLLVLVGGFAYLYFFTGLIKPLKEQKPAEVQAPQVVKKPIPARDGEPAKVGDTAATEIKKEVVAPSAGKPEPPKFAQVPVAKEAPKPREEAKKPEPSKPAVKKSMPVPAEKQEQKPASAKGDNKKAAPVEKKPPVVEKKDVTAKKTINKEKVTGGEVKAKKTVAKSEKKPAVGTSQVSGGRWTVMVGSYLLNERALSEKERLAAAGFPLTLKRAEVAIPSKNLTAGTFSDKKAAESALKKLKAAGVKATLSQL